MNADVNIYKILAVCFRYPDESWFKSLRETELFQEDLKDTTLETLQAEHTRLFTPTVAGGIPPYETEYGNSEIFLKTQTLADIAGFCRAFGLDISEFSHERVDFIGTELEFMHWLSLKEERAKENRDFESATLCREAQGKFLKDHLGRWAGYFGNQIAKTTNHLFYGLLGRWLAWFVESECRRLSVEPQGVTSWVAEPEAETEFECGIDESAQVPQPLTILKN